MIIDGDVGSGPDELSGVVRTEIRGSPAGLITFFDPIRSRKHASDSVHWRGALRCPACSSESFPLIDFVTIGVALFVLPNRLAVLHAGLVRP